MGKSLSGVFGTLDTKIVRYYDLDMTSEPEEIRCSYHNADHPVSEFWPSSYHKRGYEYVCKNGRREMNQKLRARKRENRKRAEEMGLIDS